MQHDDDTVDPNDEPEFIKIGNVILQSNDDTYVPSEEDQQTIATLQSNDDTYVPSEDQQTETNESGDNGIKGRNSGGIYNIIGKITIIFGIIVGIYLIVKFSQPVQILFSESVAELTLGEIAIALGVSILFIVPGTICIGVAKIIELLDK